MDISKMSHQELTELKEKIDAQMQQEGVKALAAAKAKLDAARKEIEEVCDKYGLQQYVDVGGYGTGATYYGTGSGEEEWESSYEGRWMSSSDMC